MTEGKRPGDREKNPADEREQEESLAKEVSEGKSLAERVVEKAGRKPKSA